MRSLVPAPTTSPKARGTKARSSAAPHLDMSTRPNRTGMSDTLKSGIEALSGLSMDFVKVHYNSSLPVPLAARAFVQGTDIHLAPGQERHLPHEAWHVVQQAQGRVQPTTRLGGRVAINDDEGLEREADRMGAMALRQTGARALKRGTTGSVAVAAEAAQPADAGAMTEDRHLPHEAWHVVQQKQRGVPTADGLGGAPLNTDRIVERKADVMGGQPETIGVAGRRAADLAAGQPPIYSRSLRIDAGASAVRARGSPEQAPPVQLMKFDKDGNRKDSGIASFSNYWNPEKFDKNNEVHFDTDNRDRFKSTVAQYAKEGRYQALKKMLDQLSKPASDANAFRCASTIRWFLVQSSANSDNKDLWKYFIDEDQHPHRAGTTEMAAALSFDEQDSPGYYNMMQSIFEDEIANTLDNKQVNFSIYDGYHKRLTVGVKTRDDEDKNKFTDVPHRLSDCNVEFPMTKQGDPDPAALLELIDEGIAGLAPHRIEEGTNIAFNHGVATLKKYDLGKIHSEIPVSQNITESLKKKIVDNISLNQNEKERIATLGFAVTGKSDIMMLAASHIYSKPKEFSRKFASYFQETNVMTEGNKLSGNQWMISTNLKKGDAEIFVNRVLSKMYAEIRDVENGDRGKIMAICRAIRALHVAHIYTDANGRLNTMLLLNKLLRQIGLGPIFIADTSVFGGSMTVANLAKLVEERLQVKQAQGGSNGKQETEEKRESKAEEEEGGLLRENA